MQIINAQDSIPLDKKTLGLLSDICKTLSQKFTLSQFFKTRVILVSDDYIRDLNKKFMGRDNPTNVLTFELGDENEVYVSVETARKEFGNSMFIKGIAFYILHALLHLEGYTDTAEVGKKEMEKLEQELWESLEKWTT